MRDEQGIDPRTGAPVGDPVPPSGAAEIEQAIAAAWGARRAAAAASPATTSVGAAAIDRFLRPVTYQGFPQAALPDELQDTSRVPRRVAEMRLQ